MNRIALALIVFVLSFHLSTGSTFGIRAASDNPIVPRPDQPPTCSTGTCQP